MTLTSKQRAIPLTKEAISAEAERERREREFVAKFQPSEPEQMRDILKKQMQRVRRHV